MSNNVLISNAASPSTVPAGGPIKKAAVWEREEQTAACSKKQVAATEGELRIWADDPKPLGVSLFADLEKPKVFLPRPDGTVAHVDPADPPEWAPEWLRRAAKVQKPEPASLLAMRGYVGKLAPEVAALSPRAALVLGFTAVASPFKRLVKVFPECEVWGTDAAADWKFDVPLGHCLDALRSGRVKVFREDAGGFVVGNWRPDGSRCRGGRFDLIHMEADCTNDKELGRESKPGASMPCLSKQFVEGLFYALRDNGAVLWNLWTLDTIEKREEIVTLLGGAGFSEVEDLGGYIAAIKSKRGGYTPLSQNEEDALSSAE